MSKSCLKLLFCLIALPVAAHAETPAEPGKGEEKITYVDHVLPIFRARCGSCHNANDRKGGLALDNFAAAMEGGASGEVIEPGDLDSSYLWSLIIHESEPAMPPNADKLPEKELATIRKWITGGALENSGSKAVVKEKPSLAKIDVSGERPAEVALPVDYYGEPVHLLPAQNSVTALAVSPWAPLVAVSGYQQVTLYHIQHRETCGVIPFPEGQPRVMSFSRTGDLLLVGGGLGGAHGRVVLYDVRTGERRIEAGEEYDEILAADLSPDQSQVALGGPKRILRVYSTETSELQYERNKHTDWITATEFSPDGVLLASGDRSNGLIVWEAHSGEIFYDLTGHKGAISAISWRPDSNVLASASEDGTIKLWDMRNGSQLKSWDAHRGGVTAMAFTRDGRLVSTGRDLSTKLWAGDGKQIREFSKLADLPLCVAFDAESQIVLAGDWTGKVSLWNAESGESLWELGTNPPDLQTQLTDTQTQLAALQQQHSEITSKRDQLQQTIAARKEGIQAAEEQLMKMVRPRDESAAAHAQKKSEWEAAQAALKKAEATVQPVFVARDNGQKEVQSLTEKIASLHQALHALEQKQIAANDRLVASEQAQQRAGVAADAAKTAATPTAAEQKLLETDEQIQKNLQARVALAESAAQVYQSAVARVQSEKEAIQKIASEFDTTRQQLQEAQGALNGANERLPELIAAADAANQQLAPHREKESAGREALAQAQTQLEAAQAAVDAAQTGLDQARAAAEPTPAEAEQLAAFEKDLTTVGSRISSVTARLERIKSLHSNRTLATSASE